MKNFLLILFILLWKFNKSICDYFYDYYEQFPEWYYLRDGLYEFMFLVAILIPFFKSNVYSKGIMLFGGTLIGWSVIDKNILNNYITTDIDIFIILPLAITVTLYYLYTQLKNK